MGRRTATNRPDENFPASAARPAHVNRLPCPIGWPRTQTPRPGGTAGHVPFETACVQQHILMGGAVGASPASCAAAPSTGFGRSSVRLVACPPVWDSVGQCRLRLPARVWERHWRHRDWSKCRAGIGRQPERGSLTRSRGGAEEFTSDTTIETSVNRIVKGSAPSYSASPCERKKPACGVCRHRPLGAQVFERHCWRVYRSRCCAGISKLLVSRVLREHQLKESRRCQTLVDKPPVPQTLLPND